MSLAGTVSLLEEEATTILTSLDAGGFRDARRRSDWDWERLEEVGAGDMEGMKLQDEAILRCRGTGSLFQR